MLELSCKLLFHFSMLFYFQVKLVCQGVCLYEVSKMWFKCPWDDSMRMDIPFDSFVLADQTRIYCCSNIVFLHLSFPCFLFSSWIALFREEAQSCTTVSVHFQILKIPLVLNNHVKTWSWIQLDVQWLSYLAGWTSLSLVTKCEDLLGIWQGRSANWMQKCAPNWLHLFRTWGPCGPSAVVGLSSHQLQLARHGRKSATSGGP